MTLAHDLSAPTNRRSDVGIGRIDASLRSNVNTRGFGASAYRSSITIIVIIIISSSSISSS